MPRKPREISELNCYHVVIRGTNHQLMFENEVDYLKYLDYLAYYKAELGFDIYAYCLMGNHIHLLINTGGLTLDSIFRHINTSYSVWFNMKYTRTGYLQEGRFHSEPIHDYTYLFCVIRYIHKNPFAAGIELHLGESYKWNSYIDYVRGDSSLVNTEYIIDLFGGVEAFNDFHAINSHDKCLDEDQLKKRLPDDVAKEIITTETGCSTANEFQELPLRNRDFFLKILHSKGISVRQLNRLTGISKGVIQRIVE